MARIRPAAAIPEPTVQRETTRRAELLERLMEYSATHGLADVSLRPLAVAVGSSPRVLLYFFGSKEQLIREVLIRSRANQTRLAEEWLRDAMTPSQRVERVWEWLADRRNAGVERLFYESYARSLYCTEGAWTGFGRQSVIDWLPVIDELLGVTTKSSAFGGTRRGMATYVLATSRGLLIDLLAAGDRARINRAFAEFVTHLRSFETPPG